jgi:hypothetical protein
MDSHDSLGKLCQFDASGVCTTCNRKESAPGFARNCCGSPGCFRSAKKLGLGDIVEKVLSAVGITKERVSAIVGGDCGCQQRQDALNELGRKIGIG